jgi:hypothetical protein
MASISGRRFESLFLWEAYQGRFWNGAAIIPLPSSSPSRQRGWSRGGAKLVFQAAS